MDFSHKACQYFKEARNMRILLPAYFSNITDLFFLHYNTSFSYKNGRMSNVNNIALLQYKTLNVATLDSITQTVFPHTWRPHLMLVLSHKVSVSVCLCHRCTQVIMFTCQDKVQRALWFSGTKWCPY